MHGAPLRLRCEHLTNPLGLHVTRPRLSWWINDPRPAEIQTGYQILAASSRERLDAGADLWDSGRVEGRTTCHVEYGGAALSSGQRVWWKVRSYDSDGLPSPWSEAATFETGLLDASEWQGQWIASPLTGSKLTGVPVPLLLRIFELPGNVRAARLYLSVLGQGAFQINGTRIAADELIPGWVDYRRSIEYRTFDVGALLKAGTNTLGVLLADGWYAGALCGGARQQYGERPALLVQLNVQLDDGRRVAVTTDRSWQWRPSWILSADPVTGESVDGRRGREDWAALDGAEGAFAPVLVLPECPSGDATLRPLRAAPVRRLQEIPGQRLGASAGAARVFGFPHPLLGRARVHLEAPAGAVLRVCYGLELNASGALERVISEDLYTTRGPETGEVFEATFSQHGFRYVELRAEPALLDGASVAALPLGRELEATGRFLCDNDLLNDVHEEIAGRQRRYAQSIPLVGLEPAERIGANAGFGAGIGALLWNLDAAAGSLEWLDNMVDAQRPDGAFPSVVPLPPGMAATADPTAAFVDVLWAVYRCYGDLQALETYYPAVRRLLHGVQAAAPEFICEGSAAQAPGAGVPGAGVPGAGVPGARAPADLVATAWFFHSAKIAARMAGVLGRLADLEDHEELAANVRAAFRRRFVTADGRLVGDCLEAYALTLGFGLLESTERDLAARHLFARCESALAAAASREVPLAAQLLPTLTALGRVDLAYRMLLARPRPRQAEDVARLLDAGAGEWLFRSVAGFDLGRDLSERHNAFRRMRIQPRPPLGGAFNGHGEGSPVRAVEAALDSVNGRYELRWQITEEAFELEVLVPGNCEAEITLPDDTRHEVEAGRHAFTMAFGEAGDGIPILREVG